MARSLKKGPFADASLLKKVDAMNAAGQKQVIKTWSRYSWLKDIDLKLREKEMRIKIQDLLLNYPTQECL